MNERKSIDELTFMFPKELGELLLMEINKLYPNIEYIKDIIKAGANLNVLDNKDKSSLWWAISIDNNEVAKLLIEAGADVNLGDALNVTPLQLAVGTESNIEIVKVLLAAGADPSIKNDFEESVWEWSSEFIKSKFPELNIEDVE